MVDDEETVRDIVSQVLTENGHETTAVASGEEALEVFRMNPYPLVLTDIRMPGMDGIELLKAIKKIAPDTQVVMITSHSSMETANRAMEAGAYDYLIKPFDELESISKVVTNSVRNMLVVKQNQELMDRFKGKQG